MQDLYKGFRKIAEDEKEATLEHEQGHKLNIAKNGLSRKQKAALKKLPLYQAEGTQVPQREIAQEQVPDAGEQAKQVGVNIADAVAEKILEGASQASTPVVEPQITPEQIEAMPSPVATDVKTGMPVAKGVGSEPAKQKAPLPPGLLASINPLNVPDMLPGETGQQYADRKQQEYDQYWANKQEQDKKISEAEKLSSPEPASAVQPPQQAPEEQPGLVPEQAKKPVQAQPQIPAAMPMARPPRQLKPLTDEEVIASSKTTASQKMMAYNNMILKTMKERQELRQKFEQDIKDKRIEPKTMYGEDTGKNILTVISLLLGGMAGGLLGQENPALKIINQEIERDIERQKANIATEQNLYKYNLDMLGSDIDAYTQSVNQMRQIALTQMEEMMGKIYDPSNPMSGLQMRAEAAKLRAEIDNADAAAAERKQREKLLQALSSSEGTSQMDPSPLAQILVTNDGDRTKIFEEIKDRSIISETAPQLFDLFDKIKAQNTALKTGKIPYAGSIFKLPDTIGAFETLINPLIKTQGPARDSEVKRITNAVMPAPYDSDEDHKTKRKALNDFIKAVSMTPVSDAYNLNLNKFKKTAFIDPEEAKTNQKLDYARKNINSPDPEIRKEAEFVLRKYGAQ